MTFSCPLHSRVSRCSDRAYAGASRQPWSSSAARGGAHRFLLRQDAPNVHISCRAVADENMAPSFEQLQKAQVDNGKVLGHQQGVSLVEGLSDCAPVGTLVQFSNGAKGAILWWHSVGLCTVLMSEYGSEGEDALHCATARCVLKEGHMELPEALQDPDDVASDQAPALSALFTRLSVPAGVQAGQVVDHLCRPLDAKQDAAVGSELEQAVLDSDQTPLMNDQVAMEARGVISEPLFTGITALDVLTPLAHGCALLAAGTAPADTTDLLLRIASHLSTTPPHNAESVEQSTPANKSSASSGQMRVVYVAAGCSQDHIDQRVERLRSTGALEHCTVVAAPDTVPAAQQYAALCTGVAIGERVRDEGGQAVVLLDSAECMVEVWKAAISLALGGVPQQDAGDMVEVNGMLVSAAAAERRRFQSTLVQRAAKRLSGGTLTLLLALSGMPASGERTAATRGRTPPPMEQYKHLSEELKAKMARALAAKADAEQASAPMVGSAAHLATETVEEMMSITDGQLVLKDQQQESESSSETIERGRKLQLDALASLSRMGTRAHPLALKDLAPKVRFELTQAVDAQRYSPTTTDAVQQACMARCKLLEAALASPHDRKLSIGETASLMWLLLHGHLDSVSSVQLWDVWPAVWSSIEENAQQAVAEMASTQQLTEASKAQIQKVCKSIV